MNKKLLIVLAIILVAAGAFYFMGEDTGLFKGELVKDEEEVAKDEIVPCTKDEECGENEACYIIGQTGGKHGRCATADMKLPCKTNADCPTSEDQLMECYGRDPSKKVCTLICGWLGQKDKEGNEIETMCPKHKPPMRCIRPSYCVSGCQSDEVCQHLIDVGIYSEDKTTCLEGRCIAL